MASESPNAGSILIGIPSFRRPEGLERLLASLAEQKQVDELNVEVFVADNDSCGREAQQVCESIRSNFRWPISCAIVAEPGISAARNAILNRAHDCGANFLAMLDDDEITASDWLFQITSAQSRFDADVVGGPMYYCFDPQTPEAVVNCGVFITPEHPEGQLSVIHATPNVLLNCRSLARENWPKFDPRFGLTGGEDREYFERLRKLGFRFVWAPMARTYEPVAASRMKLSFILRRSFSNGNADIRIRWRHRDGVGLLLSIGKGLALLATAPVGALLLLAPSTRLWTLAKWSRSLGKFAALGGMRHREYAPLRVNESR
jgi:glycosyltransferase involved in cell wall biosynthesis